MLGRNLPKVRGTSRQKPFSEIIYIVLETSVRLFQISSQKRSFLATLNVCHNFEVIYEALESTDEITDDEILPVFYLTISLNFEIYFIEFP